MIKRQKWVLLSLQWGLAFVFGYAAVASFLNPDAWVGYFPRFLTKTIPANLLLLSFSAYEIILALWLVSGKKLAWAAGIAALTLAGIIISSPGQIDITFRDIGLLGGAIALILATF